MVMSSLIQLLPDHIANQIAAGEVIQRPASVVKELMENAIDAKASKIEVNIKDSGKTLIQIVDNGSGMSMIDAKKCFERHATSKVRSADDLFSLTTKGFRGEALASIAAISHVLLKTKQKDNEVGSAVLIEGSKIKSTEEIVCSNGTSFEVKNLFYNVPARRNFLKSEKVEFNHIVDEFERIALAHPNISFQLNHNDNEIYVLNEAILRKRIVDILGKKGNDRLVPIDEKTDIVSLKGFVLKPEYAKKSRGEQFLFVNDRYFRSNYFNHAISKAFEGLIQDKSHPSYFLYLDVDPSKIDVNVHPTKTEIKFEEEKFIYAIILSSIRQALGKYNIAPTLDFERETSFDLSPSEMKQPIQEPTIKVNTDYNPFNSSPARSFSNSDRTQSKAINANGFGSNTSKREDWDNFYTIKEEAIKDEAPLEITDLKVSQETNYIIKDGIIFTPSKSGLMMIFAKRAIERIIYDDVSNSFISNPIDSQKLLFPITIESTKKDLIHWDENKAIINQLGFESEIENGELIINALPCVLHPDNAVNTINHLFSIIAHKEIEKGDVAHNLISAIAQSSSMKPLDLSNNEKIQSLIEKLFSCENHMYSPRNKKIVETLTIDEIKTKLL